MVGMRILWKNADLLSIDELAELAVYGLEWIIEISYEEKNCETGIMYRADCGYACKQHISRMGSRTGCQPEAEYG